MLQLNPPASLPKFFYVTRNYIIPDSTHMKTRPVSVTIISWFLIVTSGITILYLPFSMNNPLTQELIASFGISPGILLFLNVLHVIMNLVSGIAMLKRKKWGTRMYIFGVPIILVLTMFLYNFKMLGAILWAGVMYAVFFVLLMRKAAREYFSDEVAAVPEQSAPIEAVVENVPDGSSTGKKIAAVLLLIFGGWMLLAWFMIIVPFSEKPAGLAIVSGIFGTLALVSVIPAIFLWGRKKWSVILGSLFTTVGGLLLMMGTMIYQFSTMPEYKKLFVQTDPEIFDRMTQSSITFGIVSAMAGGLFIYLHVSGRKK